MIIFYSPQQVLQQQYNSEYYFAESKVRLVHRKAKSRDHDDFKKLIYFLIVTDMKKKKQRTNKEQTNMENFRKETQLQVNERFAENNNTTVQPIKGSSAELLNGCFADDDRLTYCNDEQQKKDKKVNDDDVVTMKDANNNNNKNNNNDEVIMKDDEVGRNITLEDLELSSSPQTESKVMMTMQESNHLNFTTVPISQQEEEEELGILHEGQQQQPQQLVVQELEEDEEEDDNDDVFFHSSRLEEMIHQETVRQLELAWNAQRQLAMLCSDEQGGVQKEEKQ